MKNYKWEMVVLYGSPCGNENKYVLLSLEIGYVWGL